MEKDGLKKMKVKALLALPKGFEVTSIEVTDDVLTIAVVSTQAHPTCPLCGSPAWRVHSHYTRTVADLPCVGQHVRLLLHVRKYFCDVTTCARKIFVERLTPFVEPWARVTRRLYQSVQIIGLADFRQTGYPCHGSIGNSDFPDDDSPTHYGAANLAPQSGVAGGHR
jgi:transposase